MKRNAADGLFTKPSVFGSNKISRGGYSMSRGMGTRIFVLLAIGFCAAALHAFAASSGDAKSGKKSKYPEKSVQIIIPVPAGADIDALTRVIGEDLRTVLGQPFFVTNMPGGALTIGTEKVAKSAPDGYVLLSTPLGPIVMQPQYRELPYKYTDLEPISLLSVGCDVLYSKKGRFKDLNALISYIKANPGKAKYGVAAIGALAHVATEDMLAKIGGEAAAVGFQGDADCLTALLGGHIDFAFIGGTAFQYAKSGDLEALGVGSAERVSVLPDCPTFKERGLDVSSAGWQGFFAPARIPSDIADLLNEEINKIIKKPDFAQKITGIGRMTNPISRAEFKKFVVEDFARYDKVINGSVAGERIKKMMK
jgi:tripartite-type tricarboxylate transporter receptor subunit TctC